MKIHDLLKRNKVKIIAEIGINHNGDYKTAEKMIYEAAKSGADAVKFQTFVPESLYSIYTKSIMEETDLYPDTGIIDFFSKFCFKKEELYNLKKYADKNDVVFISSPFDIESLNTLLDIGVNIFKLASSEIANIPLINAVVETNCPILISTGMSSRDEIDNIVNIVRNNGNDFALLHCVSNYPVENKNVNLLRIKNMKEIYKCNVGFSDHSPDIQFSLDSILIGAGIIEKHFKLRGLDCPDSNVSIDEYKLKDLISLIEKKIEICGSGIIDSSISEKNTALSAKRSLYASKDLPAGKQIDFEDIIIKRPGKGISPLYIDKILNKELIVSMVADEPFKMENMK